MTPGEIHLMPPGGDGGPKVRHPFGPPFGPYGPDGHIGVLPLRTPFGHGCFGVPPNRWSV